MGLQNFDETQPFTKVTFIVTATGLTAVSLVGLQPARVRVDQVFCINTDTIAHVINLTLFDGSTPGGLGSVSVPAGQGTAGTPSIDVLAACLPTGVSGIVLGTADNLNAYLSVAVGAGNTVQLTAVGGYV